MKTKPTNPARKSLSPALLRKRNAYWRAANCLSVVEAQFRGYGYQPHFVEAEEPEDVHQQIAAAFDEVFAEIKHIQDNARRHGFRQRPRWPMIILRTPKGWTGPKRVDGKPGEGTFRAHQVPMGDTDKPDCRC